VGVSGRSAGAASARFEHLAREMEWDIGISKMPCNWLQVAENTLDPLHIEYST